MMAHRKCVAVASSHLIREDSSTININWSKCVICQEDREEALQFPLKNSKASNIGAGYQTITENLIGFAKLGKLWLPYSIDKLNEGNGISETLKGHNACWHKHCYLKYDKYKLGRAQKRSFPNDEAEVSIKSTRRRSSSDNQTDETETCFFCNKPEHLHLASTLLLDSRVRECAQKVQDIDLLSKLSAGDMVAQGALYHSSCLVTLYNKAGRSEGLIADNKTDNISHSTVLAELVSYIEETRSNEDVAPIFKLSDLAKLYKDRLQQLGVLVEGRIHTSRLKNRILVHFPNLEAYKVGRDTYLAFQNDIGFAIQKVCAYDSHDDDAMCLAKAASIVRRDILNITNDFNGSFSKDCQETSVPKSVSTLMNMILEGPNIKSQSENPLSQIASSLSQLLVYNSRGQSHTASSNMRHSKERETPLPIYIGLNIHGKTRKRELIDEFFSLGLSISYDRVLAITTELANQSSQFYHEIGLVCPSKLHKGLLTLGAIDNIDHNPSSTTAKDSFHGTGMSLFQQPSSENPGIPQIHLKTELPLGHKTILPLPEEYIQVTPIIPHAQKPNLPMSATHSQVTPSNLNNLTVAMEKEKVWLDDVLKTRDQDKAAQTESSVSWSAHHAATHTNVQFAPCISTLLPLLKDCAHTTATIRHCMDIIRRASQYLNPGQIPIITVDQPLFAIAKQIQWTWNNYDESQFIIIMGGLHIEMCALKCLGKLLHGSGWTAALTQAGVATQGCAESFLNGSHVKRTRHAHEVTVCALHILMSNAYELYVNSIPTDQLPMPYHTWVGKMKTKSPTYHY